ncbi:hypothetical protein C4587_01765 [Candidatus Parcubacteria bacterium]|nr:MAG: hypothetical protein C4587_01765 [Candidatus Parcubacteria bacterium]
MISQSELRSRLERITANQSKDWLVYFIFKRSFYVREFILLTEKGIKEVLDLINHETPWNAEIWYKEKGTTIYKHYFR